MFKIDQIVLRPEVPDEVAKLANDLVGYVYDIAARKVVDTAVIKREALGTWYDGRRSKWPGKNFVFCVSATSTVGIVLGIQSVEVEDKPKSNDDPQGGKDGSKYNYHVN